MSIHKISRREFILGAAAGTAVAGLGLFSLRASAMNGLPGLQTVAGKTVHYTDYADIWREKWKWDKVVKGGHSRADCQGNCSFNVYVRDGIAWREEQVAIYDSPRADIPDWNPRGCQKGVCYANLFLDETRNLYPLKRFGERGGGKWKRVSWDEALTDIADKVIDAAVAEGTESIIVNDGSSQVGFGPETSGEPRFRAAIDATMMDSYGGVGDMPNGTIQTMGIMSMEGSSNDWFLSDYIVIFHSNPVYTRIPDVHFMHEARYRGAKLVVITPELSPSSVHADLWLNVKPGTDVALGLATAQVMIEENLFNKEYVLEQTDLPFLVRQDNQRFLRQSDMVEGGAENATYLWDDATGKAVIAPGCEGDGNDGRSLKLGALKPALSGTFTVTLADGSSVAVRTVYDNLREMLDREYRPEQAHKITGVHPNVIRRFAREMAAAKSALIAASFGSGRSYHSDLGQRAMILLMALTGNQGRQGGGWRICAWFVPDGLERGDLTLTPEEVKSLAKKLRKGITPRDYEEVLTGFNNKVPGVPLLLFLYEHGGYKEVWNKKDPTLPHDYDHYLREATAKGWVPMYPKAGKTPKVYFVCSCNPLRRWPMPQIAKKHLWPKLDLIVTTDFRMSTTAMHSDYVLPAAGYYEKIGIRQGTVYLPYFVTCDKAHEPLGESKGEWEIYGLMSKYVSERAKARNIGPVSGFKGRLLDLTKTYERHTSDGKYDPAGNPGSDMKLMDEIIANSRSQIAVMTGREALDMGAIPLVRAGRPNPIQQNYSDFKKGDTYWPNRDFVEKKTAWPTFTGRMQFYIDHPWYMEGGEALPVHKPLPYDTDKYPLRLGDGHNRWSIHSIQRHQKLLMRMERGQPVCFMNPRDCEPRGIKDGDMVRAYNDNGSFECMVKVAPKAAPGDVIIYHAWEPIQFKDWQGTQEAVGSPLKGLHLAGGYSQLHYRNYYSGPNLAPHNTPLQVEKVLQS